MFSGSIRTPPPCGGWSSSVRASSALRRGGAAPSEPPPYLLSVAAVFGHHLPQRLEDLDAEPLLVLLQQLLGVLDQPADRSLALPYITVHYHALQTLLDITTTIIH